MRLARVICLLLFVSTAALAQFSLDGDNLPKASIEGAIHSASGDTLEGVVTVTIEDGWHINSAKPLDEYAIPTALTLDAATAELAGV